MKVYISGPMTASECAESNFPAFRALAAALRADGHDVVDPSENPSGLTYTEYMRADLRAVLDVDMVAVLPGWRRGTGSRLEVAVALAVGTPVLGADKRPVYSTTAGRAALTKLLNEGGVA